MKPINASLCYYDIYGFNSLWKYWWYRNMHVDPFKWCFWHFNGTLNIKVFLILINIAHAVIGLLWCRYSDNIYLQALPAQICPASFQINTVDFSCQTDIMRNTCICVHSSDKFSDITDSYEVMKNTGWTFCKRGHTPHICQVFCLHILLVYQ